MEFVNSLNLGVLRAIIGVDSNGNGGEKSKKPVTPTIEEIDKQ